MAMHQRVFLLIKPDGVAREGEILGILGPHLRVLARRPFRRAPLRRLEALYREHRGKAFYPWLLDYFRGKPVVALILAAAPSFPPGETLHGLVARLVGETDPRRAAPGTVRALSDDDMTRSMAEQRVVRNLVHRSLTPEESLREGAIFFHDVTLDPGEDIRPGPVALQLVNPLGGGRREIGGIFFEERLEAMLSSLQLIPPGTRLERYHEAITPQMGDEGVMLMVGYRQGGVLEERRYIALH
jgi:nucleoside diphosphate kinase